MGCRERHRLLCHVTVGRGPTRLGHRGYPRANRYRACSGSPTSHDHGSAAGSAAGPAATTQPGPSGTGEEAFPPQAPTVPAEAFMQFEGSVTTETPNSDWSSLQGPSPTDTDVWSVTTGAPSTSARRPRPCSSGT